MTRSDLDRRYSSASNLGIAHVQDQRLLRRAMAAAFVVHFGLLFVPLPTTTPPPPPDFLESGLVITPTVLDPPKLEAPPPREHVRGERRLPVPDPDPSDELLEPEIEPAVPLVAEGAPAVDVIIPPAEPPPIVGPLPEITAGLVLPVALPGRAAPEYPPAARRIRLEGTVVLKAVVDEFGHVVAIRVLREPEVDVGFVEAAIDAVSRWRYEPGQYGGEPVGVEITIVVDFVLN